MGKHNNYSNDLKIKTCKKYFDEGVSITQLSKDLNCDSSVVRRWIKKYVSGGIPELVKETRGKSSKSTGRPKTKFKSKDEEIKYLRAQVDLLKKIRTLQGR